jgi:hypothetical protein
MIGPEHYYPTFMVQRDPDEFTETIDLTGIAHRPFFIHL